MSWHNSIVFNIFCWVSSTINITGTQIKVTHWVCVCFYVRQTTKANSSTEWLRGSVKRTFYSGSYEPFVCSLHSLAVMNDKTPEPHWNDIEGIILNDLKKGRIDRYHKPYICATRTKISCYNDIQLLIKIHRMTLAKRQIN